MRFWFEKFRKGDMRDMEHQRQIIDTFVNSVYVFDDRVVLNFNFTDDAKTVTREEVLGSSAVDNAPPKQEPLTWVRGFFVASPTNPRQSRTVQDSNSSGADCNDDERRQRRKQRGVVGAAASDTQARRSGCWVPQPVCLRRKQGGEAGAAF